MAKMTQNNTRRWTYWPRRARWSPNICINGKGSFIAL